MPIEFAKIDVEQEHSSRVIGRYDEQTTMTWKRVGSVVLKTVLKKVMNAKMPKVWMR